MTIRTTVYTALSGFIVLAMIELAVLIVTEGRRAEADRQVRRTAAILREHAVIGREFQAIRSAQNSFFLTDLPELLREYEHHRVRYGAAMRTLRDLVMDPQQVKRLNETDRLVDEWHRGATIPILQSRQRGAAVAPLVAKEAIPRAERIQTVLDAFENVERQMLAEREAARDQAFGSTRFIRTLIPLLDIALAAGLILAFRRWGAARRTLLRSAASP
jgi:CHASE3 domain sensor protein